MNHPPAPIETFDDLDHAIYDLRFRRHMTLRAIAPEVGLSPAGVRYRIRRMLRLVTHEDVDELRTEEGNRLDELRNQAAELAAHALHTGQLETALKAVREVHAITRSRATLFGLERVTAPPVDTDEINRLLHAYMQGRTDVETGAV